MLVLTSGTRIWSGLTKILRVVAFLWGNSFSCDDMTSGAHWWRYKARCPHLQRVHASKHASQSFKLTTCRYSLCIITVILKAKTSINKRGFIEPSIWYGFPFQLCQRKQIVVIWPYHSRSMEIWDMTGHDIENHQKIRQIAPRFFNIRYTKGNMTRSLKVQTTRSTRSMRKKKAPQS